MSLYRCRLCGFEHGFYSEVWWHVRNEHGLRGAEIDEQIEKIEEDGPIPAEPWTHPEGKDIFFRGP